MDKPQPRSPDEVSVDHIVGNNKRLYITTEGMRTNYVRREQQLDRIRRLMQAQDRCQGKEFLCLKWNMRPRQLERAEISYDGHGNALIVRRRPADSKPVFPQAKSSCAFVPAKDAACEERGEKPAAEILDDGNYGKNSQFSYGEGQKKPDDSDVGQNEYTVATNPQGSVEPTYGVTFRSNGEVTPGPRYTDNPIVRSHCCISMNEFPRSTAAAQAKTATNLSVSSASYLAEHKNAFEFQSFRSDIKSPEKSNDLSSPYFPALSEEKASPLIRSYNRACAKLGDKRHSGSSVAPDAAEDNTRRSLALVLPQEEGMVRFGTRIDSVSFLDGGAREGNGPALPAVRRGGYRSYSTQRKRRGQSEVRTRRLAPPPLGASVGHGLFAASSLGWNNVA